MKFSLAESSKHFDHRIYLLTDLKELESASLEPDQLAFLQKQLKENQFVSYPKQGLEYWVCLAGGDASAQRTEKDRLLANRLFAVLKEQKAEQVCIVADTDRRTAFAEGLALSAYSFDKYFSKKEESPLSEIALQGAGEEERAELEAIVNGTFLARDLVNEPLSFLTAEQLAKEAEKAGAAYGFKVEVFNKKKIESLKMGGLLAVNRGSQDPPTFSVLEYNGSGDANAQPIVLVGKGVVYDTGGLSLKPTAGSMDSMKSDMAGAAAVIGAISVAAQMKLNKRIIGLIPATDNRPGEKAYVPGDVVKMFDGSTVEVLNTDAEGRMLLADALAYAKNYQPSLVLDLATLTGAAAIAIGKYGVVTMGTADDQDFQALAAAGDVVYERTARFPFWEEYDELLKSTIADQKNIGGREAGAITAGKFLEKFTDYPWIHIDIAGPAFLNAPHHYRTQGGTGVGVRLLYQFLKNK